MASEGLARTRSVDIARYASVAIAAVLLPVMILASFDFGVTWDEADRHRNGQRVWEFVRGLRSRADFAETDGHVCPGLFDAICAAAVGWIPEEWNRFVVRHTVTAAAGWTGIIFAGRLTARLFGAWAGPLAMVLLALSPRYFASAMNNPKDLPFAAASVAALYYISSVSTRWPYLPPSTSIKIALSLAVALNVRVGAPCSARCRPVRQRMNSAWPARRPQQKRTGRPPHAACWHRAFHDHIARGVFCGASRAPLRGPREERWMRFLSILLARILLLGPSVVRSA